MYGMENFKIIALPYSLQPTTPCPEPEYGEF
jgi:hypothetical protein